MMDIVVLAGGLSTERDVSLKTGEMVAAALRENGHRVIVLDVFMGYGDAGDRVDGIFARADEVSLRPAVIAETAPDRAQVEASRGASPDGFFGPNVIRICQQADVVFMALHGEDGENGKIQAVFDLFGIRYTGTGYLGSALAMNKEITKQLFAAGGVPVAKGFYVKKDDGPGDMAEAGIAFPCVIKPCCGGSSIGVSIAKDETEYEAALKEAFRYEDELLVEEYVEGREFSVAVISGRALPVIEIAPLEGFYDYRNKYQAGSTIETCPADLPAETAEEMQRYAVRAASLLGLDVYSRMDFMMGKDQRIVCLEANTLPGMTPTSLIPQEAAAEGVNFNELCEELIAVSLRRYGDGQTGGSAE